MLHAFTHLYGVALLPLYLRIQQDFKLPSVERATLLVTVLGIAYFVPSYALGTLADRLNRKALLAAGLLINALGFVGLALSPNYGCALASMTVAGIGGSFYHPAATALIAQLFPEARGRALGMAGIGASVGFFFGPLYTGWRAVNAGSWRTPILELGLLGLLGAAAFAWLGKDTPREEHAHSTAGGKIFASLPLWGFFLGASLLLSLRDFAGSAMGTSSSLFFQNAHGFSPSMTGLALSGIFVASAISNPLFGRLSDRGRMRWLGGLLLAAAGLVFIFPRVPTAWAIPVLLLYGFFFMAGYPITEAALMESVPSEVRGRVFGLFITIGGFIGNLAHWATGDWVGKLGAGASHPEGYYRLYTILALMLLGSLSALPFLHGLRKHEHMQGAPLPVTPRLPLPS